MTTPSQPGGDRQNPMSPMPPMSPIDPGPPARPRAVDFACLLAVLGGLFSMVVLAVTTVANTADLRELTRQTLEDSGQPATEADIVDMVAMVRVALVLAMVIVMGLILLFAWKMRNGRNWARIVIVVFSAANVMSFLANAGAIGLGVDFVLNSVSVAIAVATIVYLFRGESNAYFLAVKQRKYGLPPRP